MGHEKKHAAEHIDPLEDPIADATITTPGMMAATDKSKLNGIAAGADVTGSNPPQAHTHAPADVTGTAVITTDGRLSDPRTPLAHKDSHTNGTDDIQSATAAQKGLATATQISKLDGIAAGADVTGSNPPQAHNHAGADINSGTIDGNILPATSTTKRGGVPATGTPSGLFLKDDGNWATPPGGVDTTAIHKATADELTGMTAKGTPVDADILMGEDSVGAAWTKIKITWSAVKVTLKTYFDGLYAAVTHAATHSDGGADEISVENLGTAQTAVTKVFKPNGTGGVSWSDSEACRCVSSFEWSGFGDGLFARLYYATPRRLHMIHYGSGANTGTGQLRTTVQLPADFHAFKTNGFIIATVRTGTPTGFVVSMFKSAKTIAGSATVDTAIDAQAVQPTDANTIQQFTFTPAGTYAAGDEIMIEVPSTVGNGVYAEIAWVVLQYIRK